MEASPANKANIWHIIVGGSIGNLTEWYNFLLYGYLASVISHLFFPATNELVSLTLVFSVFALSFLARPLGGILFGWIGDTYGRQRALVVSIILMGVPTFLISLLPTYAAIGKASPILLCILRVCQGLSAGGEHTGSAIYLAEYAPANRRCLWVSVVPASAAMGVLMSSLAALLIINSFSHEQLLAWGWRAGYMFGAFLSLVSLLLRISLPETPEFASLKQNKHDHSLLALLRDDHTFKKLISVFCLASAYGIIYQILFIWMPTYLTSMIHLHHRAVLELNSIYLAIILCLYLCVGYISDYVSRTLLLRISCIALVLLSYPLFILLASGSLLNAYLAIGIFTLLFGIFIPTSFVCMLESFAVQVRYTGFSFGFNLGLALFGGTCPLIVTWLISVTGNNLAPAMYMMFAALLGLAASFFVEDNVPTQK